MRVIPFYIEAGITGFESPAAEYKELGLSLDRLLIENPSATFIGLASGHSMLNQGIFDKDILIVDRAKEARHGSIIVCNFNGEFTCKRLDIHNKRLLSASDAYKPVYITQDDIFQIEGVVTKSIRLHEEMGQLACLL